MEKEKAIGVFGSSHSSLNLSREGINVDKESQDKGTKTFDFSYAGSRRHVVDASYEPDTNSIIGLEETKGKEKTNQVKRYSLDKVEGSVWET